MIKTTPDRRIDLIEQIPDPDTVRRWLADSIRRCDLLRSLLRLAVRKASYRGHAIFGPSESAQPGEIASLFNASIRRATWAGRCCSSSGVSCIPMQA